MCLTVCYDEEFGALNVIYRHAAGIAARSCSRNHGSVVHGLGSEAVCLLLRMGQDPTSMLSADLNAETARLFRVVGASAIAKSASFRP